MFHVHRVPGAVALTLILLALLAPAGCKSKPKAAKPDYWAELPLGQLALRKITPAEYPDFGPAYANLSALADSINNSLRYLEHPSSRQFFPYLDISHDRAVASLLALRQVAQTATGPEDFNSRIREQFEVYKSIGAPAPGGAGYTGKVLFTGYCTPIYDASLVRGGPYQFPLYRRPSDLAVDPQTSETIGRLNPDGSVSPYPTRAQIETGNVLSGLELVWLKSRWETYVVTVQGSARLRLPDGRMMEIGYAGHNGYDYTSPGQQMVADGVIRKQDLNAKSLKAYFDANPAAQDRYLNLNQRYIFFTEVTGGPFGCLGQPVTPYRSIATDKSVYPRAMPAFLDVPIPVAESGQLGRFRGFMLDQDRGAAIRAAGRCDIYMGIGEGAERLAGHQLNEGELYYIAVKPQYAPTVPAGATAATP